MRFAFLNVIALRLVCALALMLVGLALPSYQAYGNEIDLPVVQVDAETEQVHLGTRVAFLEDVDSALSITDVVSDHWQRQFVVSTNQIPNFGHSKSTYWLRLELENSHSSSLSWILELAFPHLNHVSFYGPGEDGGFKERITGDSLPFAERELNYRNFIFHIDTPAAQTTTFYLRANSDSLIQLPLELYTADRFVERVNLEVLFSGLFYGSLFVVALYNLFLYFSIRERFYLNYVLYVVFLALGQFSFYGYGYQLFWPNSVWWQGVSNGVIGGAAFVFAGLFSIDFLRVKSYAPILYKIGVYGLIPFAALVSFLSLFLEFQIITLMLMFTALLGAPLLLIAAAVCWRRGYSPARFYLFAWAALLTVCVVWCFASLGLIPFAEVFNYAIQIGSTIEVILLSLALADRINYEKREKYIAQKEALAAKTQAMDNLKRSDRLKDQFMATISHELRTPMNGIIGSLELMHEEMDRQPKEIVTPLKALESSSRHMLSLVDDVICFSEIRSGHFKTIQEPFAFQAEVTTTIDYFQLLCDAKGIKFSTYWDPKLASMYVGDIKRINKVILHLLDNALKFTEQGSIELRVECSSAQVPTKEHDAIKISVIDTGIGIDESKQDEVYAAFEQGDNSNTRHHGGLGIGLAICHSLISAMEGTISFASAGELSTSGTRFDVLLFLVRKEIPAINNVHSLDVPGRSLNVMIVEDNQVNQMVLGNLVKKLGHQYLTANHGGEAVELFNQKDIDLIFMDCQMPVMDGLEATKRIRQLNGDVPIIAVTANAIENYRQQCLDVGMNDFVAKPVRRQMVADILQRWGMFSKMNKVMEESPLPSPQIEPSRDGK